MAAKQKQSVRSRIAQYLYNHEHATKAELAHELSISMPTTLSSVNEMLGEGILRQAGELDSTGGRKAMSISLNPDYACAMGISITRSTVQMVLVDITGKILAHRKLDYSFSGSGADIDWLAMQAEQFLEDSPEHPGLLGCGIALPGIVLKDRDTLTRSHVLQLENYSLNGFRQAFRHDLLFENDANAALLAERPQKEERLIYLYLGRTVGGTLFNHGRIVEGDNSRAGEFGHMIVHPGGRRCYCGKTGCADPYCSVTALTGQENSRLDAFMEKAADPDSEEAERWNELLDTLALLCSNLRMAFDTDIVIGGQLGRFVKKDLDKLKEKTAQLDLFDRDISYLKTAEVSHAASAIGAAELFFLQKIQNL